MKTIPFHASFAEDNVNPNEHLPCHPTKLLEATDVLLAQDVTSGQQSLV